MIFLPDRERIEKLTTLAESAAFLSIDDMLAYVGSDPLCVGICATLTCNYCTEVEAHEDAGFCACCKTNTVQSALVLANKV